VPCVVAARSAWQRAHSAVVAVGVGRCGPWQPTQLAWPVFAAFCDRSAWQRAHSAAVAGGLPPWGTWQSRQGAVACAVAGWQLAQAIALAGAAIAFECGGWQPTHARLALAG